MNSKFIIISIIDTDNIFGMNSKFIIISIIDTDNLFGMNSVCINGFTYDGQVFNRYR